MAERGFLIGPDVQRVPADVDTEAS